VRYRTVQVSGYTVKTLSKPINTYVRSALGQGHFALAAVAKSCMARTVLVADDNPTIRKILCRVFEAEADYDLCAQATNGQEAIEQALKHRPELIILDFSMPVMNGMDAARKLKKLMPDIPIILFTQHAHLTDAIPREDLQVDRIVSKGDVVELMNYVRSLRPAIRL
jgi:CheY-like chemotaxis protein